MIAEIGDWVISRQSRIRVFVNGSNLPYARFLVREGKYWDLEKGMKNANVTKDVPINRAEERA